MRTTHLPKLFTAALAAAVTTAVLVPASAGAAPAVDRAFDLPSKPNRLALGPDGNIWITLDGLTDNIAQVTPDGRVRTFTSAEIVNPIGIVAGPDGQLWVTENGGVVHFSPADPTAARRVAIADIATANGIVVGPDRNLWTASNDEVIRIGTDERFTAFRPVGLVGARGIVAAGDQLYVADFASRQVVGVTTSGVAAGLYPLDDTPQELAAGPGGQLAVTVPSNLIGRFTPPARSVQNATVTGTDPFGIVFAPDGAYWAASFARDELLRMAPDGTVTTLTGFARSSGPRYLTTGRDGTLWVGLETSRQVARVTGVVAPPPPLPPPTSGGPAVDRTPPTISHVVFPLLRVGRSATLRLTLSEAATIRVHWERKLPGHRKAGRCVKPHRAPHGRRCARFRSIGTQTRSGVSGANRLSIGGKIGRRAIPAGFYRLTLVATDAAGNPSKPVTQVLEVNRRARRGARRVAKTL